MPNYFQLHRRLPTWDRDHSRDRRGQACSGVRPRLTDDLDLVIGAQTPLYSRPDKSLNLNSGMAEDGQSVFVGIPDNKTGRKRSFRPVRGAFLDRVCDRIPCLDCRLQRWSAKDLPESGAAPDGAALVRLGAGRLWPRALFLRGTCSSDQLANARNADMDVALDSLGRRIGGLHRLRLPAPLLRPGEGVRGAQAQAGVPASGDGRGRRLSLSAGTPREAKAPIR